MITYNEMMANSNNLYNKYMAQFVNENTKKSVLGSFRLTTLLESTNKSFNDIPLKFWDNCNLYGLNVSLLNELGGQYTLSFKVSLLKESARQLVKENLQNK